jgi:Putative amidoligase enzyme
MVPKSRTRENTYCKLNPAGELNPNDRYYAINWCSWCEHKTIEVRLHSGTTSAEKIKNWVEILDACQRHTIPTLSDFMASPYVSMQAKVWAINRIRKFNPESLEGFEGTENEGSER